MFVYNRELSAHYDSIHGIDKWVPTENTPRPLHFFKVPKNDFSNLVSSLSKCVYCHQVTSLLLTLDLQFQV